MGMQGWRRTMEDSHIAHTDLDNGVSLFGVFDGHGGKSLFHSLNRRAPKLHCLFRQVNATMLNLPRDYNAARFAPSQGQR